MVLIVHTTMMNAADKPIAIMVIVSVIVSSKHCIIGLGIYADSIGSFNVYSQIVIAVFMMLFGINFNLYLHEV